MALAGGGTFFTQQPTPHTRTNIETIELFLPVAIAVTPLAGDQWRIAVVP
jgi:RNA 3'-terminal phosphate cyclase (ATP)